MSIEIGEGYFEPDIWQEGLCHNIEPTDEYWDARNQEWRRFGYLLSTRPYWFDFLQGLTAGGSTIRRKVGSPEPNQMPPTEERASGMPGPDITQPKKLRFFDIVKGHLQPRSDPRADS